MHKEGKLAMMSCLLIFIYTNIFSQNYYGGGNGSWRKKPSDNTQPKEKDESDAPEPSGYMTIAFGFANPEGGFASGSEIGYGGFAQPGLAFHFSLAFPINHSNFGLAFMFGSYNNNYENNNYVNYLNSSNPNPNAVEYGTVSGGANNVYSESSIMGGLHVTYPIGKLSVDGRFLIGVLLNSLPEQVYGKQDTTGVTIYDLQTSYPVSFAFVAGIGLRYLIASLWRRQICATVNVDYLYSNVSYNAPQVVDFTPAINPGGTYSESDNTVFGHLPISLLNITFGIGYLLGN